MNTKCPHFPSVAVNKYTTPTTPPKRRAARQSRGAALGSPFAAGSLRIPPRKRVEVRTPASAEEAVGWVPGVSPSREAPAEKRISVLHDPLGRKAGRVDPGN